MNAKRRSALKKMIAALSVILVLLVGVAGTLAYLQVKTGSVQNTFAPSNIDLTLAETATEGGSTTANTYKMIPGVKIDKDPKVTVKADIDCYVFVEVTETTNFDTYMTYAIADGWKLLNTTNGAVTEIADDADLDGTYVLFREVSANQTSYILAGDAANPNGVVTVKDSVTKTDMKLLYDTDGNEINKPTLTFTAYAIQKAGFEDKIADAWTQAQKQ